MKSFTFKILILVFSPLLIINSAMGKKTMNIAAGAGFPEMINLGVRFQMGQSKLGLYGGTFPAVDEKLLSLGADYYYHFYGASNFSVRKPGYLKV